MSVLNDCCPEEGSLAMASFPMQAWCKPYDLFTALANGTIFPCLNMELYCAEDIPCPACNQDSQTEQEKLLNQINIVSFAINDLTLYLDTHPKCKEGLSLFKELLAKRMDFLAEYADKYYPLTQMSMITGTPETQEYGWSDGPAPWEGGHI